jgi:hypothetical protein
MKKVFLCLILMLIFSAMIAPAAAAGDPQTVVVLAENLTAGVTTLSVGFYQPASGTYSSVPVPAGFLPDDYTPDSMILTDAAISPDHRWLAGVFVRTDTGSALPIRIADLTLGACCTVIEEPLANIQAYSVAGFSEDGAQIAFAYAAADLVSTVNPYPGGMVTANVNDGTLDIHIDMQNVNAMLGIEGSAWALMHSWQPDGVYFVPNCYACGGIIEGEWMIWNPYIGAMPEAFNTSSGRWFSAFGDTLQGTGEMLLTGQIPSFPVSPEVGMFPVPNVVQYLPDGVLPPVEFRAAIPPVFGDPSLNNIGAVHWVADGNAYLVEPPFSQPIVVGRNAVRYPHPAAGATQFEFLAGTVNGYVYTETDGMIASLTTARFSDDGSFIGAAVLESAVNSSLRPYRVIDLPDLGFSASGYSAIAPSLGGVAGSPTAIFIPTVSGEIIATIPPVIIPTVAPVIIPTVAPVSIPTIPPVAVPTLAQVVICNANLPPRLQINLQGQVTPGTPNNLRAQPNSTSPIVGQIPGEGVFVVLAGPVCDSVTGINFWQVTYNGLVGWTAEGQGNVYFLEPAAQG